MTDEKLHIISYENIYTDKIINIRQDIFMYLEIYKHINTYRLQVIMLLKHFNLRFIKSPVFQNNFFNLDRKVTSPSWYS